MTPYHEDGWLQVWQGDCRDVLAQLPADSVHCVVTSPPYWGLRDYGIPPTVWGGDQEHEHAWTEDRCECGAWLGVFGLEPTPELYVEHSLEVFRAVRRVLRPDGSVWLNLGDTYAGKPAAPHSMTGDFINGSGNGGGLTSWTHRAQTTASTLAPGLKEKDLVGIPWRVALALQADGWWLRRDVIWNKQNAMPESTRDRPSSSHEYVFQLTKRADYFYDADAVREPDGGRGSGNVARKVASRGERSRLNTHLGSSVPWEAGGGRNLRSVWTIPVYGYPGSHFATFPPELVRKPILASTSERGVCPTCGAPWVRETERVSIIARRGGQEATTPKHLARAAMGLRHPGRSGLGGSNSHNDSTPQSPLITTVGWRPTCEHYARTSDWPSLPRRERAEPHEAYEDRIAPLRAQRQTLLAGWETAVAEPALVLDPFAGSGTTGMVAQELRRRAVLVDLNPEYLVQQMRRLGESRGRGDGPAVDLPVPPAPDGLWSEVAP